MRRGAGWAALAVLVIAGAVWVAMGDPPTTGPSVSSSPESEGTTRRSTPPARASRPSAPAAVSRPPAHRNDVETTTARGELPPATALEDVAPATTRGVVPADTDVTPETTLGSVAPDTDPFLPVIEIDTRAIPDPLGLIPADPDLDPATGRGVVAQDTSAYDDRGLEVVEEAPATATGVAVEDSGPRAVEPEDPDTVATGSSVVVADTDPFPPGNSEVDDADPLTARVNSPGLPTQ